MVKKNFLPRTLAITMIILSFVIFVISGFTLIAQAQTPTPEQAAETPLETLEQTAETPTLTPEPPNLNVIKDYTIANDQNANVRPDPGDKITYTITVENNGPVELTNLAIRDDIPEIYFVSITNADISKGGTFRDGFIEWNLDVLGAGSSESVSYTVTLKDPLGIGTIGIPNTVTILSEGTPLATAESKFSVEVPTPTFTPTLTPTLTPSATPSTPSPTEQPGASILDTSKFLTIIVGILAFIGILAFSIIGIDFRLQRGDDGQLRLQTGDNGKNDNGISELRVNIFREGTIIIFIVTAVLLMGISGELESDGVISILSAIVGYVFGRASARASSG